MPRAARTRIPQALDILARENRALAARKDEQKVSAGKLAGAVVGAGIAAVTGLPPQAIMAAVNVGGQVGGAVRGGQLDPIALATGGAGIFGAIDQEAQVGAERDVLRSLTPQARPQTAPADALEAAGLQQAVPEGAQPDITRDMMLAARESPTPFRTASQGLAVARAARPAAPKFTTARPGETILRDGVPIRTLPGGGAAAAAKPTTVFVRGPEEGAEFEPRTVPQGDVAGLVEGAGQGNVLLFDPSKKDAVKGGPRQVWTRRNDKWTARSVANNTQFQQLQDKFKPEDLLLSDPNDSGSGVARGLFDAKGNQIESAASFAEAQDRQRLLRGLGTMVTIGPLRAPSQPGAGDGGGKALKERQFKLVTDAAITRGDITEDDRAAFIDHLTREDLARTEITASGGRRPGIPVDQALDRFKAARNATVAAPIPGSEDGGGIRPAQTVVEVQSPTPAAKPRINVRVRTQEKPFTPAQAAKVQMLRDGVTDMKTVRGLIYNEDGSVDWVNVGTMQTNFPKTEGREARQALLNALEARIRAESGAAVPDSEIVRLADRFMASVFDSKASVDAKFERAENFFNGTLSLIEYGRGAFSSGTIAKLEALGLAEFAPAVRDAARSTQSNAASKAFNAKYGLEN